MKSLNIHLITLVLLMGISVSPACSQNKKNDKVMKFNKLTIEEENVILNKGTEYPFTGEYVNHKEAGIYTCKQCDSPLYSSEDKFDSHCGWPSFDDEMPGKVKRIPDADGRRTEIVCAKCGGHLGHVFEGEGFTEKDTRHCVNSISMNFIPLTRMDTAYFASGCFWGTQYHFMKAKGVVATAAGYMGGHTISPTYKEVCTGTTGHIEVVEVIFDSQKTSFEDMVKLYYETHDFEQVGGQGPDIGEQYQSVVFYVSEEQKAMTEKYIKILSDKGYKVATQLRPAPEFWAAEEYHQEYYDKKNGIPYCHAYKKIF